MLELCQSRDRVLLEPSNGGHGRHAQTESHCQCFAIVEKQRGHLSAGSQPIASARPCQGFDGVSELSKTGDVTSNGPCGDTESIGELLGRPVDSRLEQSQELQESFGGVHPDLQSPEICGQFLSAIGRSVFDTGQRKASPMFYINYDLARQIAEDRRAEAMARAARRRGQTRQVVPRIEEHAEVIELAFGAYCETEQIGA